MAGKSEFHASNLFLISNFALRILPMTPLVSAIVLNYRTPQDAVRCVQALLKQSIADQIEILVVENHSLDDSIGVLRNRFRNFDRVRVIETQENRGYGYGNNFGERFAMGEFFLFINPDTELEPQGLARLVAAMKEDKTIGILAPKLEFDDGTIRDSFRSFPTMLDIAIKRTFLRHLFPGRMRRYLQHDQDPSRVRETDWVVGACFLIRCSFYKELGGFDERFFLFFEDTDLCRRCWEAGKRVVFFPEVYAMDRKRRLSQGGILSLLTKRAGRAHVISAIRYFWKWRKA